MKSIDYVKAFLEDRKINYSVVLPLSKEHRWKWVIRLNHIDIYMIHNSRFLIMKTDYNGILVYIEAYMKTKYEVVQKLEGLV